MPLEQLRGLWAEVDECRVGAQEPLLTGYW